MTDPIPDTELPGKKRKAKDVVELLISAPAEYIVKGTDIDKAKSEAQVALRDDLLAMLPKKNISVDETGMDRDLDEYERGHNGAVDLAQEAIREYFGEDV